MQYKEDKVHKNKTPDGNLTFIISDRSPFYHMQEPVEHRVVTIELTQEQKELLFLRYTSCLGVDSDVYENISRVIYNDPLGETK